MSGRGRLVPRRRFERRSAPSKDAVMPLDERRDVSIKQRTDGRRFRKESLMSEIIPSNPIERLWKLLTDKDYRRGFNRSHVGGTLAAQILNLRSNQKMTQKKLAEAIGTSQSQISAWESSCDNISLASLHKIADAFDVGLIVRFAPFSEVAKEAVSHRVLNMVVVSFHDDSPNAVYHCSTSPARSRGRPCGPRAWCPSAPRGYVSR